ncbi:unnamed protein product, partial [Ectocarpus sp. 12 AP-2014]
TFHRPAPTPATRPSFPRRGRQGTTTKSKSRRSMGKKTKLVKTFFRPPAPTISRLFPERTTRQHHHHHHHHGTTGEEREKGGV